MQLPCIDCSQRCHHRPRVSGRRCCLPGGTHAVPCSGPFPPGALRTLPLRGCTL